MQHYTIDVWQDESIWTWAGYAASSAEAEEMAREELNCDWEREYKSWDDLASDMDGTAMRSEDATTARAREEAPALLAARRELADFMGITGDREGQRRGPMADNVRAILARIDGGAASQAAQLRADALALDTGMDPALVRELHAEADRLEGGAA